MWTKRHFDSFDALRFLAFFKVFVFHLPIDGFPVFSCLKAGGGIGVMFFFVLSGFLISYIILEEKEKTDRLNLKHFLIRRILRIWPLYYLMVAFAYLSPFLLSFLGLDSSSVGYEPNWWYTIGFLENYRMIGLGELPNVAPLGVMWSLCIEEHFYLLWGTLFFFLDKKHLPTVIFVSIGVALLSRYCFSLWGWDSLDLLTNLDLFAVGAIPAYLLIRNKEIRLGFFYKNKKFKGSIFLILLGMMVFGYPYVDGILHFIFGPMILAMFFAGLLVLFVSAPAVYQIGEGSLLSRWGKYTYGLYVYHTIVIALLSQLWRAWDFGTENVLGAFLFALLCFGVSLGISIISYRVFERPFLRLKRYFY